MQKSTRMSTTFKFVLDKRRPNNKGTFPIRLRIFQGAEYKDFSPGISLSETGWDETLQQVRKTYPDHRSLNATLDSNRTRLKKVLHLAELESKPDPALDDLIVSLKRQETIPSQSKRRSIIKYGLSLAEKQEKAGKVGNGIIYKTAINRLRRYVGTDDFGFSELTYSVLHDWNVHMLSEGLKVNAISNYLRTIRAIYNKAIKEEIVAQSAYPFNHFIIKNEKTVSRSLSVEEMRRIAFTVPSKEYLIPYRNLFLLSFCLIGMNFSDLLTLTPEHITEGRFVFRRKKTNKIYSIKIHPKAAELLATLRQQNEGFLLPFVDTNLNPIQLKKCIKLVEHRVNNGLKKIATDCGIQKELSTYYARYAWANIAKKACGYSKDLIAEAFGHQYGNKITGIYLDEYDSDLIDQMNETIIVKVFVERKKG